MNKKIQLLFLFSCVSLAVFSQDIPVNSGKLILEGIDKYDNEKYEEALKLFKKIPEYDTNGTWAMYETAMTLSALKKNDESYDLLKKLVYEFKYLNPSTYTLWGNAADDKGSPEEALSIYREGLRLYPVSNMLAFNTGITFFKQENFDSSYQYAMRSANINPLHSSSFNLMGMDNVKKGRTVPAMLNFIHAILLSLDSKASATSYNNINALCSGGFDADLKKATKPYEGFGADFKDADYLINSRSALSSSFQKKFKLRETAALQLLLLLDLLEEEHEKIPFYGPLHVKFLRQVKAAGLSEVLAYSIYIPTEHPTITSYIKKNDKAFKQMMKLFVDNILKFREEKELSDYGLKGEFELTYHKQGGGVETAISKEETPGKGKATYLFSRDGRLLLEGYSKDKNWEGEVVTYSEEGFIDERRNYEKGEQMGENKYYYIDGTLRGIVYIPKNSTTDTLKIHFYYADGKTTEFRYNKVNDKYEGTSKIYFPNGNLKVSVSYKNNELNGPRVEYFENGKLRSEENYKNGKRDGSARFYYSTGGKYSEGNFKEGEYLGEWKTYYENGKLSSKYTYNDKGIAIGKGEDYYEDGSLSQVSEYDMNGNQSGSVKQYGLDGKVHTEYTFANKKVKSCKTYDSAGNIVNNTTTTGKKLEFYKFNKYHKLLEKGTIENDERSGIFIEYRNGQDTLAITPYKNGKIDGEEKKYFKCGRIKEITNYKSGLRDGKYAEYNLSGNIIYTGYYVNDGGEGYWKYYNSNGSIDEIRFFRDDERHGKFRYFDSKGNTIEEDYYDEGKKTKEVRFQKGVAVDTIDLRKGVTNVEYKYANGTLREKYTILNGVINGPYVRYFPNGKIAFEATYVNGYTEGEVKRYYADGKPLSVIQSTIGRYHGKAVWYNENGKIDKETSYNRGDYDGLQTIYYATGKKFRETSYSEDEIDGDRIYYAPDGKVIVKLVYENSILVGYTYHDKNGQYLPLIPLERGNGKVTAYYSTGAKSCEFNFSRSYFDGKQIAYYPGTESPIFIENYANFQQNGEQVYYDYGPNKKSEERTELNDNVNGVWKEYHANGRLAYEGDYDEGEIVSYEKRYNETGALVSHLIFENGILVGVAK